MGIDREFVDPPNPGTLGDLKPPMIGRAGGTGDSTPRRFTPPSIFTQSVAALDAIVAEARNAA